MTTTQHITHWVVTDDQIWKKMLDFRKSEIRAWLKLNGVAPGSVPAASTVMISERTDGSWEIQYEQYQRAEDGCIMVDPDNPDEAYVEFMRTPLAFDPPMHWLTPITCM